MIIKNEPSIAYKISIYPALTSAMIHRIRRRFLMLNIHHHKITGKKLPMFTPQCKYLLYARLQGVLSFFVFE